ncbi:MAG TPA: hypothetical protein H9815_14630 [Candidatus Ruania gallistercoris]|uniref:Uncharacterized protein n=1 Tax=Candidatus Ruania gallistercoris TaxID=2838746 RepID=A0A9D2EGM4_9MICO|nr:hypothetical protein [Candidatus Ruania gallistercoris]
MIMLLKHEFLRTKGMLAVVAGAAFLLALAGTLLAATGVPVLASVGLVVALAAVLGLVPAAQLALAVAYWRSSYGRTGYLTQTLPVRGSTIFWAKTIWAWMVSLVGAGLSVAMVLAAAPLVTRGIGAEPGSVLTTLQEGWATLNEVTGTWGVVAALAAMALMILIWPTHYFFAASIGSQAPLNRMGVAGPVVVWLGLYVATQVVTFGSFAAIPVAVGMTGDQLGFVRFQLFEEMTAGVNTSAEVMPVGFLPALLLVTVVCLVWSVRSWNRRVSLV